jgi:hypothetical protein
VRIRGRRAWLAGIFALFIFLMQVFPVIALAEGVTLQPPQLQAPSHQAPHMEVKWEKTNLDVEWDIPDLKQPPNSVPHLESPSGIPVLQPPKGNIPQLQAPGSQQPTLSPVGNGPLIQPTGVNVPNLQPPESSSKTKPKPDVPFGETPGYQFMELSLKDIMGGTLSYSAALLQDGNVTIGRGSGAYGLFLLQAGLKGVNIGLEDGALDTITGIGVDVFNTKAAFDGYKFVADQILNRTGGGVNTGGSITNPGSGGAGASGATGLIKGLNVAAAVISLPFDVYNMWTKFDQSNNPDLAPDQQNEKFVEGVGSLGNTLMNVGIITAAFPGAQVVGGVIFGIGAALWVGSTIVKWANKASSGAVTRWIREKTGNAVGWLKSIFS